MELRHLKYFIAVAEELHFSKAAKRLNISQPPLSQQIDQLENEIGVKLLYRTKRHVELTKAGKQFLEETYYIFNKLDESCEKVRKIHEGELGQLKIAYTGLWSNRLIQFLHYYRSKFPNVNVILQQMATTDQIKALHEKRIQIAVPCQYTDSNSLNSLVVHRVPFVAAFPSNHPLAHTSAPLDIAILKDQPFIMSLRKKEPNYYDTIISLCYRSGFSPKIYQEVDGIFTILTLVEAGWGVSLVTKLAYELQKPGVVYKEIEDTDTTVNLSLTWRKDENSPIVNTFITTFREWLETESTDEVTSKNLVT